MRIDKFLALMGVLKRQEFKKEGVVVYANDRKVKASKNIQSGDRIRVETPYKKVELIVLKVPKKKNIPKNKREEYIEIIEMVRQQRETTEFLKWLMNDEEGEVF